MQPNGRIIMAPPRVSIEAPDCDMAAGNIQQMQAPDGSRVELTVIGGRSVTMDVAAALCLELVKQGVKDEEAVDRSVAMAQRLKRQCPIRVPKGGA